jgi:hypothetical protein
MILLFATFGANVNVTKSFIHPNLSSNNASERCKESMKMNEKIFAADPFVFSCSK